MDAVTKTHDNPALPADIRAETQPSGRRPSRTEAEAAVRTLIAYAGDDPSREGLLDTPRRVVAAYDELFGGYHASPVDVLDLTFSEIGTYDDLLRECVRRRILDDAFYLGRIHPQELPPWEPEDVEPLGSQHREDDSTEP